MVEEGGMSNFTRNRSYTRAEIHAAVGGSLQAYLPTVDGVVVAGCFRRDISCVLHLSEVE